MDIQALHKELEEIFPKMVEIRRDLHENPELGFEEVRTPQVIADYLRSLDIDVRTEVGGRGVVGTLKGGKPGKTIALRADFDALPIQDEKDVEYKSKVPNKMHACGHDGHTATLLGVATVLAKHREELEGTVVFLHQHAEEIAPGGAKPMVEDGCLDGVDYVFGAHLSSTTPCGTINYCEGYTSAAADAFEITINGKGGHGAHPHTTVDPVLTVGHLVVNLQQIVSRNVDPIESAVLSIGSIHTGNAGNVIPDSVTLNGTIRSYDPDIRDLLENRMKEITEATCALTGASCEIKYSRGYDALWNHPKETQYLRDVAIETLGEENVSEKKPGMGAEDFTYYVQKVPGTFFNVGARLDDDSKVFPHHHPRFDIKEDALLVGAKVFVAAVANANRLK
ncbi:M20 family metallopeptidase [Ornithinibacillus sp. 4-3]|uniref:M20 family metallopeptidase n=1 Tax=Ornithinibacillus sp. 4-3 TaxID=3231488 RepID=A0AB39HPR7_9BACI